MPQKMIAFGDLGFEVTSEKNPLGTVRIANPEHHVIQYTIWNDQNPSNDAPPNRDFDYLIPKQEKEIIRKIVNDLDLNNSEYDTKKKVALLRKFFSKNFK